MWVSKLKKWLLSKQSGSSDFKLERKGMFLQKQKDLFNLWVPGREGAFNLKKRLDLGVLLLFVFFFFSAYNTGIIRYLTHTLPSLSNIHTHKRAHLHAFANTHSHMNACVHTHSDTLFLSHACGQKMGSIFWMYDKWVAQSICSLNRSVIKQRETLWF